MKLYMHGWNSAGGFWHGPTAIVAEPARAGDILRKLRKGTGGFCGKLRCRVPGTFPVDFMTTAYDLGDAGLAIIHVDGETGGPVAAVTVLPAQRRAALRKEFAFGFAAVLNFLGGMIPEGSELAVDDYIENALQTEPGSSLVFTAEAAEVCPETGIVLSAFLEKLSVAMLRWLCERDATRTADEDADAEIRRPGPGLFARM